MIYKLENKQPTQVGSSHFIADNATIIGDVTLEDKSSVWFNAVLRGDREPIVIGEGSNVQDGAVLHADPGYPCTLGKNVTVGHKAVVHGCSVGDNSLIGINAVILNGAKIGANCLIGACALVTEHMEIPDGSVVMGCPGKVVKTLKESDFARLSLSALAYIDNAERYCNYLEEVVD